MTTKLKDYQVLDVLCGGTFYKVRHKVTNNIFAWKAHNCSTFSDIQIQNAVDDVKTISKIVSDNLLQYYDTLLHAPSKTLYFVLEYNSWRSVQELLTICTATDKYFAENFIWHLLLELARVCKAVEDVPLLVLQKCFCLESIFVNDAGELRINCFDLVQEPHQTDLMLQVGNLIRLLCYRNTNSSCKIKEFQYSDDLFDVITLLSDDKKENLQPDVVLYHPAVLSSLETHCKPSKLVDIFVSSEVVHTKLEANKCDSQKAVELCRAVEPAPRRCNYELDSPIYYNVSPKIRQSKIKDTKVDQDPVSPTIAALALELPGFVPRSRQPYSAALVKVDNPQKVSEETLSDQWMSRLIALRQREESLNKRERDLIAKEIISSPTTKIIPYHDSSDEGDPVGSNGITLPPLISQATERNEWVSRRRQRRSSSVRSRPRRKSYAYEDLDSSLSADAGDGSIIVTSTKFTKENMPRRTIFPEVSTKKVHFTSSNPFAESDESVTLTYYELENNGNKPPPEEGLKVKDIKKFKYFGSEKLGLEKRVAKNFTHSSPSKQAKYSKSILGDITNSNDSRMKKTPSKCSLVSKGSNSSRFSAASVISHWSMDSFSSKASEGCLSERTASSVQQLAQTPHAPPDLKKSKRKSLLPFKTPFKFKSSSKV